MIKKLALILKYFKRSNLFFIISSLILISILEVAGVGIVIPFISILLGENLNNNLSSSFFNSFISNFNQKELVLYATFFIIIFFTFKSALIIYVYKHLFKYVTKFSSLIRDELFKNYIYQDYEDFIKKDQTRLIANISNVTFDFSNNLMTSILIFLAELFVIFSIFIFMLIYNFGLSIILIFLMLILSLIYFKNIAPKLKKFGFKRVKSEENVIKYSKLGFQNIKELKVFSKEKFYLNIFRKNTKESELSNYFYNFSAQFPKIGIELFSVIGISTLIIFMLSNDVNNEEILSILAFFAVAIFRMIPSINRSMFSFQTIRYNKQTLDVIFSEIKNIKEKPSNLTKSNIKLKFNNNIEFRNISFGYNDKDLILNNVSFKVKKGDFFGLSGESGSGKSTLLDIMIGLIKPQEGEIFVDNKKVQKSDIQNISGYVSQNLFFFNDTIEKNIAFGEDSDEIDKSKLHRSIQIAQLVSVTENLDKGTKTLIGENGLNLSGGQRQRLAIARALYRNPEILFFDEATNALDENAETKIIQEIKKFIPSITIILVSHNKKLINICDRIFEINNKNLIQKDPSQIEFKNNKIEL